MTAPTARQLAIHAWMLAYQRDNGMPPTLREMNAAFGFKSSNSAFTHLRALEGKGLVEQHRQNTSRGWIAINVSTPPASEPEANKEPAPRSGLSRAPAASTLEQLHDDLSDDLDRILRRFVPGAKVTLVVRNPSVPGDTGVVIGNDDLDAAIAEIRKQARTGTITGGATR